MLSNFDMYGQNIKFSNKRKQVFSTYTGSICSILIYITLIGYFFLLIANVLKREDFNLVEFKYETNKADIISLVADSNALFDIYSEIINYRNLTNQNTTFQYQWSLGFLDSSNFKYRVIDPRYFYVTVENKKTNEKKSENIYFDICNRFAKVPYDLFQLYNLNKTYCLYNNISLQGDNPYSSIDNDYLEIKINKCVNNTNRILPRPRHPQYLKLFNNYVQSLELKCSYSYDYENCIKLIDNAVKEYFALFNTTDKRFLQGISEYDNIAFDITEYFTFPKEKANQYNQDYIKKNNLLNLIIDTLKEKLNSSTILPSELREKQTYDDSNEKQINDLLNDPRIGEDIRIGVINTQNQNEYIKKSNLKSIKELYDSRKRMLKNRILDDLNIELADVVCAPENEINDLINKIIVVLITNDQKFNFTSSNKREHVSDSISRQFFYLNSDLSTEYLFNLEIVSMNSHYSLIPKLMESRPDLESDYITTISSAKKNIEKSVNSNVLHLILTSSFRKLHYRRSYMNILQIFALVGGLYNILIFVVLIFIYGYISFRYDFSLIEQAFRLIDPETNIFNLDFEKFISSINTLHLKLEEKKSLDESELEYYHKILAIDDNDQNYSILKIKSSSLFKFYNRELTSEIKFFMENKTVNEFEDENNMNSLNNYYTTLIKYLQSKRKNDKDGKKTCILTKLDFLRLKIVYQIFRFKIRKRISINFVEIILYIFCKWISCCKLRQKFNIISHAKELFFDEKNLSELLYSNKDFINLKGIVLDKNQKGLFNSIPIEKIEWKDTQQINNNDDENNNSEFNDSQYLTHKNNKVSNFTQNSNKNNNATYDQNYPSDDEKSKNNFDLKQNNYYNRMIILYDSIVSISSNSKSEINERLINMIKIPNTLKDEFIDEVNSCLLKKINFEKVKDNNHSEIKRNYNNKNNLTNKLETDDTIKETDLNLVFEKFGK